MEPKFETIQLESPEMGKKQIEQSYQELELLKKERWDEISQIRKNTQSEENRRNMGDVIRHKERLEMLKKLENTIPEEQAEIEEKIHVLMEIEQADTLVVEFDKLKQRCDEIIKKKKAIILEFSKELNYKDQLYVDSLKKFRTDVELMITFMRKQFHDLRSQMLDHIKKIEDKFNDDRNKLIESYKKNIDNLISQLKEEETKGGSNLSALEEMKEDDSDKSAYKKEMEMINKIYIMEKHFNFLKENIEVFTYDLKILNEKLDYRVEVRSEKIKENEEKDRQYTKWSTKLKERINENRRTYVDKDHENRVKNNQLKDELSRMTDSYDKLKEKFQHFEKYDELKFKFIYDMKSKEAKELALKVALADRTIKNQQLGIEVIINDNPDGFSLEQLQKEQDIDGGEDNISNKKEENNPNNKNAANQEEKLNVKQTILSGIPTFRIKQVFMYIITEAEFLIDLETIEACDHMSIDEKLPRYIDSICKALNIKNDQELNQLMTLFEKHNLNSNEDSKISDEGMSDIDASCEEQEKKNRNFLEIDPDNVMELLKEFYLEKKNKAKEQLLGSITSNAFSGGDDSEELKKERMKYLSEIYWTKLGNIISPKTFNVWKALYKGLTNYHDLLFDRKQLVDETKALYDKNIELKRLLQQYMQSDDNKALKIPPHQTIKRENLNIALSNI